MDGQCERCKTEYEFDDALVSGRGTTVRCTSCGHQFKVRRSDEAADRWTIKKGDGQDLTFFSLRDLQHAISSGRVNRDDVLVRGGERPRMLGALAELDAFFVSQSHRDTPMASATGSASLHAQPVPGAQPVAPYDERAGPPSDPRLGAWPPPAPGSERKIETLRPAGDTAAVPPPPSSAYSDAVWPPPPTDPVKRPSYPDAAMSPRDRMPSSEDVYSVPQRRVGAWVVAAALLVAVGVVGWAAAKPYLALHTAAPTAQVDPRVAAFLADGEKGLSEGNVEAAQEDFDKASALAENSPRVLVDQARLAVIQADLPWLRLRLLAPDANDEKRTAQAELDQLRDRALRAAEAARAASPDDPATVRAQVDALRISGDRAAARALVAKLTARDSDPETAYVLAALDLAESEPVWPTVIERLRLATSVEGVGRSRDALIYALARSGDVESAKSELAKLDASTRPVSLLANLHAYVDRLSKATAQPTAPQPSAASTSPTSRPAAAAGVSPAVETMPSDPRVAMQAASVALKHRQTQRARQLYQSVVDRNPNDSEALSGLGDAARMQGNANAATENYRRAIAVNPSYLPALLGLADTQWAMGQRTAAVKQYADIVDRFPEGTYPPYVAKRAESGSAPAEEQPAQPAVAQPAPTSDTQAAPPAEQP
jgi:predicted Zn finger-like uncharacterized protein